MCFLIAFRPNYNLLGNGAHMQTQHRSNATMMRFVVLCGLYGFSGAGTRCHFHEEVRDGDIWIVDCFGNSKDKVDPLAQGEFRYKPDGITEWSSRDERMSTIAIDLAPAGSCTDYLIAKVARCLQIPHQYAWCGSATVARFSGDNSFPSYAESASDMVRVGRACASENATVRPSEPIRAYNARHVRKMREARQTADDVCIALLVCVLLWCCCCDGCARRNHYTHVRRQ